MQAHSYNTSHSHQNEMGNNNNGFSQLRQKLKGSRVTVRLRSNPDLLTESHLSP